MPQKIVIAEQVRIAALLTDERVDELIVAQGRYQIGDVFLGTIENVLPGIDAAFVNIGTGEKNGFIHVTDLGPLRLKKNASGINELLEPRQKVLVQVMKEPTGSKGPRLTGNIALPGRYLVLQPNGQGVNISRRINSENERNRLRALGVLIKPPGTGLLIRSEANEINEELIINDLESLLKQWESIQSAAENSSPPVLLNREEDFINRVLRDHVKPDLSSVILDTSRAADRAKIFLGDQAKNIETQCHNEPVDILEHYKITNTIFNALKPRVDLPSGGYIIIEPTEALTVIDVNSGSFTRSANSRETVLWTNCEAAIEIARQLKLRNIGGVIIIDFIDMESRRDQLQLLEYFTSSIKDDTARPQIAQLTELGLVELTRKRQGQNIYELFSKTCSICNGLGYSIEIPGKEEILPIASQGGLIQSEDQFKKSNISQETNYTKSKVSENDQINEALNQANNSYNINQVNDLEVSISKQEPEILTIQMNEDQEIVYSYLGLSPTLLLDNEPSNRNINVQIVRPGEDINIGLEEVQVSIDDNTNKRTKVVKSSSTIESNQSNDENESSFPDQEILRATEIEEIIETEEEAKNELNIEIQSSEENKEELRADQNESEIETDEPRRRRRRSSASNEIV